MKNLKKVSNKNLAVVILVVSIGSVSARGINFINWKKNPYWKKVAPVVKNNVQKNGSICARGINFINREKNPYWKKAVPAD